MLSVCHKPFKAAGKYRKTIFILIVPQILYLMPISNQIFAKLHTYSKNL